MAEPSMILQKIGNPQLREVATPITEFGGQALLNRVARLTKIMRESEGLGLAAPQVGWNKRVIVMEVRENARYPQTPQMPLLILIQAKITPLSELQERAYEGCLSIPQMRGPVWRYASVKVDAYDVHGAQQSFEFHGPFARIVQHEVDHLDGILYFDRIREQERHLFGHEDALKAAKVDLSLKRETPARWLRLQQTTS